MRRILLLALPIGISISLALAACGDGPDAPPPATATPVPTGTTIVLDGATVTASGLRYVDEVVGTGPTPAAGSFVTVHYVGRLAANGEQFDSSHERGQPSSFPMGGVIKGFAEAISTMQVGGKRIAYVPSDLAYAEAGRSPSIGPNADLVFEIELIDFE